MKENTLMHGFQRSMIFSLVIVMVLGIGSWNKAYAERAPVPFAGGDGTEASPYLISTASQLNEVRYNLVQNKHFKLINDIDLSIDYDNWEPIANNYGDFFNGVFDGNGHKILNLTIKASPNYPYTGLFGQISSDSVVKNLGLENVNINVFSNNVGGIAGNSEGTIMNSYTTGSVSGANGTGGLVGYVYLGTVSTSYSTASVTGGNTIGGLVASIAWGTLSNSYATGNVSGTDTVGGLLGWLNAATITNSYAIGAVTSKSASTDIGGLVGKEGDWDDRIVLDSYYNSDTALATGLRGVGLDTDAMKNTDTYASWDKSVWAIDSKRNNGYPFLKAFYYYVTYDGNGSNSGSVPIDSATYDYNDSITVIGNIGNLSKSYYEFAGWNTSADGSGQNYDESSSFEIQKNTILYAKWAPISYTVSFDSNWGLTSNVQALTIFADQAGKVDYNQEIIVSVPAGATKENLILTITKWLEPQQLVTENDKLISSIYQLSKDIESDLEMMITFKFDSDKVTEHQHPAIFYYDEANRAWVEVEESVIEGNSISIQTNKVAKYALFLVEKKEVVQEVPSLIDIEGHWAEAQIIEAIAKGFVNGFEDRTFKPNHSVSRAEFAVMLAKALKLNGDGVKVTFRDADTIAAWAKSAVAEVVEQGIMNGYKDGSFRPNANISRAEVAVMIARAQGVEGTDVALTFSDVEMIPKWAKSAVAYVNKAGIMTGKSEIVFQATAETTRAEAVTIILRLLQLK
ncbi:MAG: S-layer homology domain-containing protein [Candidatus Cohnella colombiensis]|uniref:S-layer homology domain-containing protein n=1 Tax=Candidatus Cohnella colombiensis TaxID=3121368 RepID=A0AA95EX58_9BACL|nr:MAG: S-layer homology domain-containing protein [Cohnella sp.]